MNGSHIIAGARTPIGRYMGALSRFTAMDLGGFAIKAALERAGVAPEQVDYVIMGQVLQAGQGQITARQAARAAGIPYSVPAITLNKVCLSGLDAIALADQLIRAGEVELVVAGGMESMSQAPHLIPNARFGYRLGHGKVIDSMIHDGLWCAFADKHMGEDSDEDAQAHRVSREEMDAWSARSHQRAAEATKGGRFGEEIVPVSVPQRKKDPIVVEADEGIRPETTAESLANLKPAFNREGAITAGNASQISDGAAAVIVASARKVEQLGLKPQARILAHGMVAGPEDTHLHQQPSLAAKAALAKLELEPDAIDLYEINEAFASVALASARDLGVSDDKVNVNGGAVALGHPIGCTGARLVVSAMHELARRGGGRAVATLCGGGGQGDALVIQV